jgi:hypothetical protein
MVSMLQLILIYVYNHVLAYQHIAGELRGIFVGCITTASPWTKREEALKNKV